MVHCFPLSTLNSKIVVDLNTCEVLCVWMCSSGICRIYSIILYVYIETTLWNVITEFTVQMYWTFHNISNDGKMRYNLLSPLRTLLWLKLYTQWRYDRFLEFVKIFLLRDFELWVSKKFTLICCWQKTTGPFSGPTF